MMMSVDYSIVVPAYNEVAWLPDTFVALRQAMAACSLAGEIIVTDNNSTDDTAELARKLGATVVFEPVNQISRARNTGARSAKGKYLIFVDADTHISPELLNAALDRMQSGKCCGGGSVVKFDRQLTAIQEKGLAAWTLLSKKLGMGAGCFLFCHRDDFEQVGGFSEAVYASEEIWFSKKIKKRGKKHGIPFCIIDEYPVISSGRKFQWFGLWQQLGLVVLLTIFPFAVRYKRLCNFWYERPKQ
ncbi:MAG: glycosyltransferase [Proteobacteria bacterium]|nr:glycosyltransferase [Pseudomonadota bacterium]